jgi:hypothetical protein
MTNNAERLAEAIRVKSEIEGFLANLEKLKSEKAVDDEQYLTTRKDYYRRLGVATSEIARIKNEVKEQLSASEHSLELARKKLDSLDVKRKVGELSNAQYEAAERKMLLEIRKLEKEVEELNSLVNASSAADISTMGKRAATRASKPVPVARETPPVKAAVSGERIAPAKGPGLSRGKLMAIIGAAAVVVIAVVVVFLFLTGDKEKPSLPDKGPATVDIPVNITGATGIGSLQFELIYDSKLLSAVQVESGTLPVDSLFEYRIDAPGRVIVGMVYAKGISGDGSVAFITFQARGEIDESIPLHLENVTAHNASTMSQISATASSGSYSKDGASVPPVIVFSATDK